MNARFWVWHNSDWAKLTLREGQELQLFSGKCHRSEGYSCRCTRYTHRGVDVLRESAEWGRDCDGRHESFEEARCPLGQLAAAEGFGECPGRPAWIWGKTSQRDESAEMAGY